MNDNGLDKIRNRIREQRLSMGFSFQDLANRTKLSKSTLQRYETGDIGNLPLDKLEVLAKALETTPQYLMGWETFDEASDRISDEINRHITELEPQWAALFAADEKAYKVFAASNGFVFIKRGKGYTLQRHMGVDNDGIPVVDEIHLTEKQYSETKNSITQYVQFVFQGMFPNQD